MNDQYSGIRSLAIIPLPAFRDNYLWLLRRGNSAAIVDPGDAAVVEDYLAQHGLDLCAILLTHHHDDHIGGVAELIASRAIPVFGPAAARIRGVNRPVAEGDEVELDRLGLRFEVLEVPGHTATHIAYHAPGILFCGDTLFSAGCGRLLGGTAAQLHASLARLGALPGDTAVYCTHEYTLANLAFAHAAEPQNRARDAWEAECRALRAAGRPTLPSSIERERRVNPFLRTSEPDVIDSVAAHRGARPKTSGECFAALRAWKDSF
jgi:hydroxyacylglutathione hydrolase